MDTDTVRIILAGLIFTVIFVSGYRLKRTGKPYNVFLVTIHKLIAVTAFILLIATMIRLNVTDTLQRLNGIVAGLFFLILIASGAFLTLNRDMPVLVKIIHHIASYLTLLFMVLFLCLLK